MTLTINQDVLSYTNVLYASKGEKVSLIFDAHYPVLLVEGNRGNTFSVRYTGTDYSQQKKDLEGNKK